jgi:predicted transcriptional regulator YheO
LDNLDVWEVLKQITRELGEVLGDTCEVVLHDFETPESSIVAISHGEISGRRVGDPTTNLGLPLFHDPYSARSLFNYRTQTKSGKTLKSSSILLKNGQGKTFSALCINWDISQLQVATHILENLIATSNTVVDEVLTSDIGDVLTSVINDAIQSCNKPVEGMTREDKQRVVEILDKKGTFAVKHSVDRVASALAVSRVTIYSYLNQVRAKRENHVI